MLKKILLLSTIIFISTLTKAASFGEQEEQRRMAAGEIHGIFNLYQDSKDQLAITKTKPLNVYLTGKQTYNIVKGYPQKYREQKTTEQKAQFAFQFMQDVAAQADYTVFQKKDSDGNKIFRMTTFEYNLNGGRGVTLIPAKDMKAVFPRLLALIKTQNKVSVKEDSISSKYYQIIDGSMPGLFDWPQDEEWFPEWDRWIRQEINAICYTNTHERLCEDFEPNRLHDYDGDGIPEEICGEYFFYYSLGGGGDSHLHCVGNNG